MRIQLGDIAEWVAAVGTVSAFGATWVLIRRDHVLRATEHRDVMFDEALNVVVSHGPVGGRPVNGQPRTDAAVTVHNQGDQSDL